MKAVIWTDVFQVLVMLSGDAMLFQAFCNVSSSWIAFFFFLFFSFFGFHLCLQLDREKLDHRTEAKFESLVLGPLVVVVCPGCPQGRVL